MSRALKPLFVLLAVLVMLVVAMSGGASGAPAAGAAATPAADWKPNVSAAAKYAGTRRGQVSFTIIGLNDKIRGYRPTRTAPLASVVKVMLLAAYLRKETVRDRDLTSEERALLGPMIMRSNNAAAQRVSELVGAGGMVGLAKAAGMKSFRYKTRWGLSSSSSQAQALFMKNFDQFIPPAHLGYARFLLASITPQQRWGIGKVRHTGWKLYFKGGWGIAGNVNHQVAFLRQGDQQIGLAIFTRFNPNHAYGKATLQGVAARLLKGLPKKL